MKKVRDATARLKRNLHTMVKRRRLFTLSLGALLVATALGDDIQSRIAESQKVVREFTTSLQAELRQALEAGGPMKAIQVCSVKAPEIAANASAAKGWVVGRTSLKLRNPDNAPDAWEREVLEYFESEKEKGADIESLEYTGIVEKNGKDYLRYMKAIPTVGFCVLCHGSAIAPALEAKLKQLYPDDKARGFRPGDIRGAFTIIQPM